MVIYDCLVGGSRKLNIGVTVWGGLHLRQTVTPIFILRPSGTVRQGVILNNKLSDYTWISAARYIRWVSTSIGLKEINSDDVWSFRVTAKAGWSGLLKRKERCLRDLELNLSKLVQFQESDEGQEASGSGIAICMYNDIELAIPVVSGHIDSILMIMEHESKTQSIFYEDIEQDEGGVPF